MEQTILYRHFNSLDELLYVGISRSPFERLSDHRQRSHWFNEIESVTMERFSSREEALRAEVIAIKSEKPKYNTTHNGAPNEEMFSIEELGIAPTPPPPPPPEPKIYLGKIVSGPLSGFTMKCASDWTLMVDKQMNPHSFSWADGCWHHLCDDAGARVADEWRAMRPYAVGAL